MQHRLALATAAGEIAAIAVVSDLRDVPFDGEPSADLSIVFLG